MAGYDGSIRINTQLNSRGFERGARGLLSGMNRLGNSLRGIISSLGFGLGIASLVALGKQAIDTASDIQEVQNVVDTAFGSMSYKMEEFAKTSVKQFGISQLSAKQLGSTFMAMGASMLDSAEKASDMAINLTARAADMASFYNKSIEETSTALKSIYTQETESLKEYGVVMTQVNLQEFARQQGINKSIQAMTQAEKVELQYAYVMQQTALAAGDFARTSDSWANQTRILSEQFKELLSVLGSGLITVLTPVIKFLNTVLTMLIAIAKQIGAILSKLFGISFPVADSGKLASDLSAAAGGADDLADGMDAAGSAAKKAGKEASKALAPFDKLNVLSQESGGSGGSGSGGGAGGAGGGFEMPELSFGEEADGADALGSALDGVIKRLKELKDLFVQGFFDGLGEGWKKRIEEIKADSQNIVKNLMDIFSDPAVVSSAEKMMDKISYSLGQISGSIASVGITIAQNVVGGIDKYLTQNKDFLKQKLISIFDIRGDIYLLIGEAVSAISYIFEAFGDENGQQLTANIIGIFTNTIFDLLELGEKFGRDILSCITKPISDNKEELKSALDGLLGVAAENVGTIKQGIDDTFAKINEVYDEHFKPFFDSIAQGLSDTVGKFLEFWNGNVQPILEKWAEEFNKLWKEHIQPMLDKFVELLGKVADFLKAIWENILKPLIDWIIENVLPVLVPIFDGIVSALMAAFGAISDIIGGIIDVFSGIIQFLIDVFSGNWEEAWEGIKETFSNAWNGIKDFFSGIWESLKNLVSRGIEYVKNSISEGWERVKLITSTVWNGITDVLSGIWENLKNSVSNVFSKIKTTILNIWDSIKEKTSNIWDGIKNAIKTPINAIIGFINKFIDGIASGINALTGMLNNLQIDVPDGVPFVGGMKIGFDIPQWNPKGIPYLADGAVIRGGDPFMAVLGDQRHGQTNIETPLPTMIKAFKQAIAESGGMGGGEYTFVAQLDGKTIFEETVRRNNIDINRLGRSRLVY